MMNRETARLNNARLRTTRFLEWKREPGVKEDEARLFGRSNLSVRIRALPVEVILNIYEFLQPRTLVECIIMFEFCQPYIELSKVSRLSNLKKDQIAQLRESVRRTIEPLMTRRNAGTLSLALRLGTHAYQTEIINYFLGQLHGCYGLCQLSWTNNAGDRSSYNENYTEMKKYLAVLEGRECSQWIKKRYAPKETKQKYENYLWNAHRTLDQYSGIHPSRYSFCTIS